MNIDGQGSYDNNGDIYLSLWDMNDPDNPVVLNAYTDLDKSDISTVFKEYTFTIPPAAFPMSLADLNKRYDLNVMYNSSGAVDGKTLNIDIDEASRNITYDSVSSNCVPTISPSSTSVSISSSLPSGSSVLPGSSLSATDPDGDTLSYSITAGNGAGYFSINSSTGDIATTQTNIPAGTYTLTVQVDDGKGGTASADVTIIISGAPGQGSSGGVSAANSTIQPPKTGVIILSLILIPMLIALGMYLYIAHHNKANIQKRSER